MTHILQVKVEHERDWTWVAFTNWQRSPNAEIDQMQKAAVETLKAMRPRPHWGRGRSAWYFKTHVAEMDILDMLRACLTHLGCTVWAESQPEPEPEPDPLDMAHAGVILTAIRLAQEKYDKFSTPTTLNVPLLAIITEVFKQLHLSVDQMAAITHTHENELAAKIVGVAEKNYWEFHEDGDRLTDWYLTKAKIVGSPGAIPLSDLMPKKAEMPGFVGSGRSALIPTKAEREELLGRTAESGETSAAPELKFKTINWANGLRVSAPVVLPDSQNDTLIMVQLVGPAESVKANWAALMSSNSVRYVNGCAVALDGMKAHVRLEGKLPCGAYEMVLIHNQATYTQLSPAADRFYLTLFTGSDTTHLMNQFVSKLNLILPVPMLNTWASYLWDKGTARQLVLPVPQLHCVGGQAWKVLSNVEVWQEIISEGLKDEQIKF